MRAIVHEQYGPPEVLRVAEMDAPALNENQLLVRVQVVSLNPAEAHMRNGMLLARLMGGSGLLKPKNPIIGADFAGRVEAVGANVSQYQPGDEVFGRRAPGGFAELVAVSEKPVARIPAGVTMEQAAALPVAGLTALQSLRDSGKVQPGQRVLVNGAGGGVGTFTVQLARHFGAEVTAVCSARNAALVCGLGAQRAIDYAREDFTSGGAQYDLIIDNVGNYRTPQILKALKPGGICVGVGFTSTGLLLRNMLLGGLASREGRKLVSMTAATNAKDLAELAGLVAQGHLKAVIDRVYPLAQAAEAYRYLEAKHAAGKVIVQFQ